MKDNSVTLFIYKSLKPLVDSAFWPNDLNAQTIVMVVKTAG